MKMFLTVSCSMELNGIHYRAQLHGGTRFVVRADGIICHDVTDTRFHNMTIADFAVKTKKFAEKTEREVHHPMQWIDRVLEEGTL